MIFIKQIKKCDLDYIDALPEAVRQQLDLLDDAQRNLLFIFVSIALRLQTLGVQKQMLLAQALCPETFTPENYPDPFVMQVVASILTLYALLGFHKQAQGIASQAADTGSDAFAENTEALLGLLVIFISLVRFGLLLDTSPTAEQNQPQPAQLEAALEDI